MRSAARYRILAILFMPFVAVQVCAQQAGVPQQPTAQQQGLQQAPLQGAQQPAQQAAQQPVVAQTPAGFELNVLQQQQLDLVLNAWERASGNIKTFRCSFERWEYDNAFGPRDRSLPLNKNLGRLTYQKPDKGSFEIYEIRTYHEEPAAPAAQPPDPQHPAQVKADWVKQPDAIGEQWVCDGKSVYEYRKVQKQVVERPIPPELQGKAIVDGPLPFLFGADANKLKQRYWMKIDQPQNQDPNEIWIASKPKFQQQAADFSEVDVILYRDQMLPHYMQVLMPNGSRHVYIFDKSSFGVNNLINRLEGFFTRPRPPGGWTLVVEKMQMQQAAQPVPVPR
jgi:TIGR03009 family protein